MSLSVEDGLLQVFYVDHGQCALLSVPSPAGLRFVMVDCGHAADFDGAPWYPGAHLQQCGVKHIDVLILTNYDEDHVSGFPDLIERGITVGCILGNPTVPPEAVMSLKTNDGMGKGIRAVVDAQLVRRLRGHVEEVPILPGVEVTWAWNPYPFFDDENNLSLVVNLNIHGWNFMFPGDLELKGWRNLLATCLPFQKLVAGVHVLSAAHHGRESGKCTELFETYRCRPRLVVISDDYKQYDTQETTGFYASKASGIGWFRESGARKVLTTRKDGEVKFSFQAGGIRVW